MNVSATAGFSAYFTLGFVIGIVMLKWPGAKYESPVGTLFFTMIAWPIFPALLLLGGFLAIVSRGLSAIGIKAHESDSHGC